MVPYLLDIFRWFLNSVVYIRGCQSFFEAEATKMPRMPPVPVYTVVVLVMLRKFWLSLTGLLISALSCLLSGHVPPTCRST